MYGYTGIRVYRYTGSGRVRAFNVTLDKLVAYLCNFGVLSLAAQ